MPGVSLLKYVVTWYWSSSQRSSIIICGAPASMSCSSLWFILIMSTSLCVRSSSLLSPLSSVIDGLTFTGGTRSVVIMNHSGLVAAGSIPSMLRSSSLIFVQPVAYLVRLELVGVYVEECWPLKLQLPLRSAAVGALLHGLQLLHEHASCCPPPPCWSAQQRCRCPPLLLCSLSRSSRPPIADR